MKRARMDKRIGSGFFFMGLFALTVTAVLYTLVFYNVFSQQAWNSLKLSAQQIAAGYHAADCTEEALNVYTSPQLRITLITPDGTVVYDSTAQDPLFPFGLDNHLSRPEICDALEHGEGKSYRYSQTIGERTCYYAMKLADGCVLRVAQNSASIWGIFFDSIPAILIIALILLVFSLIISFYFTKKLLHPLHQITEHLDMILENVPYEELVPLAKTIHSDRLILENANKMRQEFTANVSHELKTPLTSISGYAELIESGLATSEYIAVFAGKIRTEAGRMLELVNDILSLSRLDGVTSAEIDSAQKMTRIDLSDVALNCADRLRVNAQRAYVTLTTKADKVYINGDRAMLDQLCQNLCDNALRYNRPGGRVILSTGLNPEGLPYLQVKDNGIGIPEESQSRVFERFYRVDKSRSKATGGTGLGLAIVKHIALVHGAQIRLESKVDEGTCITVTFPKYVV